VVIQQRYSQKLDTNPTLKSLIEVFTKVFLKLGQKMAKKREDYAAELKI
jgi:hypothetical protein